MLTSHAHLYHQSVLEDSPADKEKEPWDEYTPGIQQEAAQPRELERKGRMAKEKDD